MSVVEGNLLSLAVDEAHQALRAGAHVWLCDGGEVLSAGEREQYLALLSAEELARYRRFVFEQDGNRFLTAHALLRKVLSRYSNTPPQQWRFESNAHGRPSLAGRAGLYFNLSHTQGLCACMVSAEPLCGVDVENIQRRNRLPGVAQRMFAESELQQLRGCDDAAYRLRFFQYWTLREAYVKALGTGLSASSRQFWFELQDAEREQWRARLCFDEAAPQHAAGDWRFYGLRATPGHVVAVALGDHPDDARVQFQQVDLWRF